MSSQPQTPPPEKHNPYAAFLIPNYRLYVLGWFLSLLGTRIQSLAIGWDMYERTGDPLALGLVGLAQAVPSMLLALPAGYLADRFERPRLVLISLLGMTLTSLALASLSYWQGSITMMYVMLALDAAAVMIGRPARVALLPQLVPPSVLPNAITWNMSLMQISGVLGPALGGIIILWGVPVAYASAALSSLLFAIFIYYFKFEPDIKEAKAASFETLVAGIRFVLDARIVFTMITLDLFAVLLGGAVYLLPIYAKDILQVGEIGFSWLRAAPAVGAFVMAMLMVYLPPMKRAGLGLLVSIAGFGIVTIIFGISTNFWLSCAMLCLAGAFDNISMVVRHTMQQLLTPNEMRGRVSAVTSVFTGASNELGGLESGLVAGAFGPVVSVVSGGIGTLLVVAGAAWLSPQLRALGRMEDTKTVSSSSS